MAFFVPLLIGGSAVAGIGSFLFNTDTGEIVEGAVEGVTSQIPVIIEAAVPALMEGIIAGLDAIIGSVKGREIAFFSGLTVITLTYAAFKTIQQVTAIPK